MAQKGCSVHKFLAINEKANWHSASNSSGYGTPGYENSQHSELENISESIVLSPDVFSPDEDGYNDVMHVQYQFTEPGFVANIIIYNNSFNTIDHPLDGFRFSKNNSKEYAI